MTFPSITIASFDHATHLLRVAGDQITHVISINQPHTKPPSPLPHHKGAHLILYFHDISQLVDRFAGCQFPELEDVQSIIEFAQGIDETSEVLIHCAAGISRSSAAALTVLASKLEPSAESAREAVQTLLSIKETINPNKRMVKFADDLLGYDGELVEAHAAAFGGSPLLWVPPQLWDLDPDDLE